MRKPSLSTEYGNIYIDIDTCIYIYIYIYIVHVYIKWKKTQISPFSSAMSLAIVTITSFFFFNKQLRDCTHVDYDQLDDPLPIIIIHQSLH